MGRRTSGVTKPSCAYLLGEKGTEYRENCTSFNTCHRLSIKTEKDSANLKFSQNVTLVIIEILQGPSQRIYTHAKLIFQFLYERHLKYCVNFSYRQYI